MQNSRIKGMVITEKGCKINNRWNKVRQGEGILAMRDTLAT